MADRQRAMPDWFLYLDVACAAIAGATWYVFPQAGPWPLVLALAPWLVRLAVSRRLTRRTAFDLPSLLFLLTAGVAVWAAYDRQAAWSKFWLIVGGVLLFYALANAAPLADRRAWLPALFAGGIALYFLATNDWDTYPGKIQALERLGRAVQARLPSLPGHRLHPNIVGGILAMMLPFAGWLALNSWRGLRHGPAPRRLARWFGLGVSLGLLALVTFGLLMTTARGAWVGLAGALVLAAVWLLSGWLSHGPAGRRLWILTGLLMLGLLAVVGAVLAWPGGPAAVLNALPVPESGISREVLLRNTLPLVRDYPFIGAGLGSFQMLYSTYALLIHVGFITHSHNLLLDVSVEQGLPALLLLAATWLLFAARVRQRLTAPESSHQLGVLGPAVLSLTVLLLHGLVDDALYSSGGVLVLFVPLAFAVPPLEEPARRPGRGWAIGVPVVIALLLGVALVWRGQLTSLIYSNLGAVHQSQTELSVYSWPEWPLQDAVRRAADLGQPIAEFERALALDPRNATANRRLGMIELSLGNYEAALGHLAAAYAAEPASVTTRELYGEALLANGHLDEGRALWSTLPNEQNQLAARVFWYEYIGDEQRLAWMKEAAAR
jgi:O-antigen ligase